MIEQLVAPPLAYDAGIAQGVARFATKRDFKLDSRHQDEPLWYVWTSETKGEWTVRRYLQVGVFRQDAGPFLLKALASVILTSEERGIARVSRQPLGEATHSLRDNEQLVDSQVESITYELAERAWSFTEGFDESELDEVKLPSHLP